MNHQKSQPSFSVRCSRTIEIGVSEVKTYMKVIDVGRPYGGCSFWILSWSMRTVSVWNCYHPLPSLLVLIPISGWWFQTVFIFHNMWDAILPIDFHILQRGRYTTNQFCVFKFQQPMFLRFPLKKMNIMGLFLSQAPKKWWIGGQVSSVQGFWRPPSCSVLRRWSHCVVFFWRGDLGIEHGGLTTRNIQKLVYM